ncbi:hypothetical protein [Legionella sp. 29fVS95]|uniref:hypothetical protein n=1 Tax=Legionella sp. 29fVS95 TaxID=3402813 RepID=UPI003AF91C04
MPISAPEKKADNKTSSTKAIRSVGKEKEKCTTYPQVIAKKISSSYQKDKIYSQFP